MNLSFLFTTNNLSDNVEIKNVIKFSCFAFFDTQSGNSFVILSGFDPDTSVILLDFHPNEVYFKPTSEFETK